MKQLSTLLILLLATILFSPGSQAQGTWDKIYTVMQTNCSGSGCHSGLSPYSFSVDSGASLLYDALVNKDPLNPYAKDSAGNRLIFPGQPHKSFFLRKIAHGLDAELELKTPNEGVDMPQGRPALEDSTIELVRQWILYGAPETGTIHNEKVISDYYANPSDHVDRMQPLAAPIEGQGFQVHLGPIFLKPSEEVEYFLPYDLELEDDIEVTGLEVKMNVESHHYILYSMDQNEFQNTQKGLRELELSSFGGGYINAWQSDDSYELPEGTAFFWEEGLVLDLNYHIFNYNTDKILPTEVYMNVYTQPKGIAEKEMHSSLLTIGNGDPTEFLNFQIPDYNPNQPNQTTTFTEEVSGWGGNRDTISLFMLSSHTHSWGIGYDIFLRDTSQNDNKGEMIYNGDYNFDYTFDMGQYDWEHPAVRRFENLRPVDMNKGLVHEATYVSRNSEGKEPHGYIPGGSGFPQGCGTPPPGNECPLTDWSFQTTGEMMLIYLQYVEGVYTLKDEDSTSTSIADVANSGDDRVKVYPNPFQGSANIVVDMAYPGNLEVEVFDMVGKKVASLSRGERQAGSYRFNFSSSEHATGSTNGIYFIRINLNGEVLTKKLVEMQ